MNRVRLAASFGVALLAALGCASKLAPQAESEPGTFSPLLWRAEPPEVDGGVLYLLGSVHVGSRADLDFGPSVDAAYAAADEIVVEVDLSDVTPLEIANVTRQYGTFSGTTRLADVVSPECYALLDEYLVARESSVDAVEHLEPWLVTVTLSAVELRSAGYASELGVDRLFINRAAGHKPIVGLETIDSQLAMLDGLPFAIQELMLMDVIAPDERFAEEAAGLLDAWQRGDELGLAEILFSPLADHPEAEAFYEAIFYRRNQEMTARLRELGRDGKQRLVILGAGHMVGDRGIPTLLESAGYRVERIGGEER